MVSVLVVASAPATAQGVNFSGPTNFPAGTKLQSVAAGDFNGDSRLDLAVANYQAGTVSVLLGDGTGAFTGPTSFPVGSSPDSIAVADFNGDLRLDLAVANWSGDVSVLLGNGSGGFTGPTSFPVGAPGFTPKGSNSVAVGNFNGDVFPDLAVANASGSVSVLLGNGSGGFTGPTNFAAGREPWSVAAGEFNGDSRPDLAVANRSGNVSVLLGNGSGGFTGPTNFPAGSYPLSVAVGDFNGDTHPDLSVGNFNSSSVSVLLGNGSGGFTGPTSFPAGTGPGYVAVADFDSDTHPDLAVPNYGSGKVSVLLGDGTGAFTGPTSFPVGSGPDSVATADFNGDSRPDLAVANHNSGNVSVLLGQPPAVSINDVTHAEGDSGTTDFTFTVSLASPSPQQAQVTAQTQDGSATVADSDYQALPPTTLTFAPGETQKQVTVKVNGDTTVEADEAFQVQLSGATNAILGKSSGLGVITNDDSEFAINDVTRAEGDSGTTDFVFTVSLSEPRRPQQAQVTVQSQDGTATADSDYSAISPTTLTFAPGETSKLVTVKVIGDTDFEPDENFTLKLSSATNASIATDTGVGTIQNDDPSDRYPRPKGATPMRVPLVPAFSPCTTPNRTHGPPLNAMSCKPPAPMSPNLTIGTPDANGQGANASGFVLFEVMPGDPTTAANEADLRLRVGLTDIRNRTDLSDYTGELQASVGVRSIDRYNGTSLNEAGTSQDFAFSFTFACTETASTAIGSSCDITTTANAVMPNGVREGKRTIWQLGQVRVFDGGDDGFISTGDNTVFAKQGIFVP